VCGAGKSDARDLFALAKYVYFESMKQLIEFQLTQRVARVYLRLQFIVLQKATTAV